jgi:hypothetical protein
MPSLNAFFKVQSSTKKCPSSSNDHSSSLIQDNISSTFMTAAPSPPNQPKKVTQLYFDFISPVKICPDCHMTFNASMKEDQKIHKKFHTQFLKKSLD